MTATSRKLLLAFGLLGLAAASTSSYVHYKLLTDPSYTSFCDVNPSVSCAQAYLSRYGSILGVPVALGGVLFFAVALLLAGAGGRQKSGLRDAVPGCLFAWSSVGFLVVLYLAWASYVQLKNFCILCSITYVAVTAILIISSRIPRASSTALPLRVARDLSSLIKSPLAIVAGVLLTAGMATLVALFPRESTAVAQQPAYPPLTEEQRSDLEKWWVLQPKVDLPIPNDGATVLDREVQRLHVPRLSPDLRMVQARARQISLGRAGALRREALPARGGMQSQGAQQSLCVVRGSSRGDHGGREGHRPGARTVDLLESGNLDA